MECEWKLWPSSDPVIEGPNKITVVNMEKLLLNILYATNKLPSEFAAFISTIPQHYGVNRKKSYLELKDQSSWFFCKKGEEKPGS